MENQPNSLHVQDAYIQRVTESKQPVNIFLMNGIKLHGVIEGHDNYTLLISGNVNHASQLVYKHAISTIQIAAK
jgi:host factor-I protein